jgi:hypothetical protein
MLEWYEQDGAVLVRRAGRFTSSDVHHALLPKELRKGAQGHLPVGTFDRDFAKLDDVRRLR